MAFLGWFVRVRVVASSVAICNVTIQVGVVMIIEAGDGKQDIPHSHEGASRKNVLCCYLGKPLSHGNLFVDNKQSCWLCCKQSDQSVVIGLQSDI